MIPSDTTQQKLVSVEQVEADYHAKVRELMTSTAERQLQKKDKRRAETLLNPFGFQNKEWEALKAQMKPKDELWEFCSDKASWNELMGVAGYELRRDGIVITMIIGRRS
jgi:hypothetical protein